MEFGRIIQHERVHQRTVEQFGAISLLQLKDADLLLELILDRELIPVRLERVAPGNNG